MDSRPLAGPERPIEWASGYSEICAARADRFGTRFQLENTGGTCMTMVARLEARHQRAPNPRGLRREPGRALDRGPPARQDPRRQ
jgi:hypothetical protein